MPALRSLSLAIGFLLIQPAVNAGELLNRAQIAPVQSSYGRVSEISFTSDLTTLKPGVLAFCSNGAMKMFQFSERVWVIGYATEIADSQDKPPVENYLCHTFFGNRIPRQGESSVLRSLYSDAFTREVRFPEGFGTLMEAGEQIHWMPMYNNRTGRMAEVRMTFHVWFIPERERTKPIRALYGALKSVQTPDLYYVPPGRHSKKAAFDLPVSGRIHFIGTHVHPYAEAVILSNNRTAKTIWTGSPQLGPDGKIQAMQTYSSADGIPIDSADHYTITAIYNNPTSHRIDAMAGLFLFFTRDE